MSDKIDLIYDMVKASNDKIDAVHCKLDKKVGWTQYIWITGILLAVLTAVVGFNYRIDGTQFQLIDENKECIHNVEKDIIIKHPERIVIENPTNDNNEGEI